MKASSRLALWGALASLASGCAGDETDLELPPAIATSLAAVDTAGRLGGATVNVNITIVNGADGNLEDLAAAVSPTASWLGASLDKTTATRTEPATLRLSANPANLQLGESQATVVLTASGASNSPFYIPVRLRVGPRAPAKLVLVTQPSPQAVNGQPLARQPVLQLLNSLDEPALEAGVQIEASVGSGGGEPVGSFRILSDADGRAAFTDLGIKGLIGSKVLHFTSAGLALAASSPVLLAAGPASRLEAASVLTQSANVGTAVATPPRARVTDLSGNPIAGVAVGFAASAGSSITPAGPITSGQDGIAALSQWTLPTTPGSHTVVASSSGLEGSPITFTATGQVGPPTTLVKQSGDNLTGIAGTTLGTPHVVKVADAFGNGVAGLSVSWSAVGGGSVNPATSLTDDNGLASATRTLGPVIGPQSTTATATISGSPTTVTFAITAAMAGPAKILKVAGDNQTAFADSTLPVQIQVQVLDAADSPTPNITVSFTTPNAGGSFPSGASVQTDASGRAAATWRLGPTAGTQTAQAAVGGPAPAVFSATAISGAVSGTNSTIAASPNPVGAGSPSTITVTARDRNGNPVSGLNVVLALVGSGTLTQPAAPTNALGRATGAYTSNVPTSATISATAGGVAVTQTATVTVTAGPASQIVAVTATSLSARFGQSVSPAPKVKVMDALGNAVAGHSVTFSASPAGGNVLGANVVSTNGAGEATVSWSLSSLNSARTSVSNPVNVVSATAAGLNGSPVRFTANVTVFFSANVQPIFSAHCALSGCHVGAQVPDLRTNLSYNAVVSGYVLSGDSTTISSTVNKLIFRMTSAGSPMPTVGNGGLLPANLVSVIKAWIKQGVPNN